MNDPILTRKTIAAALNVHRTTITLWARAGVFPDVIWRHDGRFLGMRQSSLDAWIKNQTSQYPPASDKGDATDAD